MSYQVLARKYRPQVFTDVVGQQQVLKALTVALDQNRLHHAYLFTGTRGVGKTTIARILAKSLNCDKGITSNPCGQCQACSEITEGRFVDLIEVDAASRTKVEDTRELLDNVQYAPTSGRFKVYLIDEVHMLSTHSFNALLKTLEEPPEHVKFLLATTDPQKLPITVLSRCLQFALKNMKPSDVVEHLGRVLDVENVSYEEAALWMLARSAEGSMRDALSLTDQAIAMGDGKVSLADVSDMLGTLDRGKVIELADAVLNEQFADIMRMVDLFNAQNTHFDRLLVDLLELFHQLALQQWSGYLSESSDPEGQWVCATAAQHTSEKIQLYYQVLLVSRRDLPLNPSPKQGFEMTLMRLLSFQPPGVPMGHYVSPGQMQGQPTNGFTSLTGGGTVKKPEAVEGRQVHLEQLKSNFEKPVPTQHKIEPKPISPLSETVSLNHVRNDTRPLSDPPQSTPSKDEASVLTSMTPTFSEVDDRYNGHKGVQPATDNEIVDKVAPALDHKHASLPKVDISGKSGGSLNNHATSLDALEACLSQPSEAWPEFFDVLNIEGLTRSLFENACLDRIEEGTWHFTMAADHVQWMSDAHLQKVEQALSSLLIEHSYKQSVKVKVNEGSMHFPTPADFRAQKRAEKQKMAESAIMDDPNVKQMLAVLDAQVIPGSLKPIDED